MNLYITQPIQPATESFREKSRFPSEINQMTDSKVKGLVLERIGDAIGGKAGLLPSATAPRIMIDLLASLSIPSLVEGNEERRIELIPSKRHAKRPILKRTFGKKAPIGLRRCEPYGWINAWMQFLLFLPGVPDLFCFASRNFDAFREFVDQYFLDQQENHPVSSANGASLVKCLLRTLPFRLFKSQSRVDLYEIHRAFFKSMFSQFQTFAFPALLRPDRHLIWEVASSKVFEEEMQKKIQMEPPEIFVAVRGIESTSCRLIQRQFFSQTHWHFYDLDAFIEHRSDGRNNAMFVTYVKVDGSWYQCDDDRIIALRSTALSMALHRSILLHYQQIELPFGRNSALG